MRVKINNADLLPGKRVQNPGAVAEGRLMTAAEDQRTLARALAGGYRFAQRLLRCLQRVVRHIDSPHIHAAVMSVMAGHIGQRPAQGFRPPFSAGAPFIAPNPFITGESQQGNVASQHLRLKTLGPDDSLKQAQRVGRLRAVVASLPKRGGGRLP